MLLTLDGLTMELHEDFRGIDAITTSRNKEMQQNLYIVKIYTDFPRQRLKLKRSCLRCLNLRYFSAYSEISVLVDHSVGVDDEYKNLNN